MAKKRSKKRTGTRRRRRVGALSMSATSPLMVYGPIAAGFFLGDKVNAAIDKMTGGKIDSKIVGAGQAGIGALLVFGKGRKTPLKNIAGGLALGSGVKRLMADFGIGGIGGYQSVPVIGSYGQVPVIGRKRMNGYTPNQSLNGVGSYNVPTPLHSQIMGSVKTEKSSGSGVTNSGGGEMMG